MSLGVRRPTLAGVPAVVALGRALEEAIVGESEWTEDDVRADWEGLDLERDATGAARVYERVGMRALFQSDVYEKTLVAGR